MLTVRAIVTQATKEMLIPAVQNQTHVMMSPAERMLIVQMAHVIARVVMKEILTQVVRRLKQIRVKVFSVEQMPIAQMARVIVTMGMSVTMGMRVTLTQVVQNLILVIM